PDEGEGDFGHWPKHPGRPADRPGGRQREGYRDLQVAGERDGRRRTAGSSAGCGARERFGRADGRGLCGRRRSFALVVERQAASELQRVVCARMSVPVSDRLHSLERNWLTPATLKP